MTGRELERNATGKVKPKAVSDYKYIGKSIPRLDIPAIMTGQALYIQEQRPDGMVHGAVVRPPTYKAKLKNVDTAKVEKMPGVLKVVRNGSFLGIIASRRTRPMTRHRHWPRRPNGTSRTTFRAMRAFSTGSSARRRVTRKS